MHFQIEVVVIADDGTEQRHPLTELIRSEAKLETVGLTLSESQQVLHALQETMVQHQAAAYLEEQRPCPQCGKRRELKQTETAPFRTLFGIVDVPNPRWRHCPCQQQKQKTFRPLASLLPERTSPELLYLETKWAALVSYELTATLLHEVFPIDKKHSAVTVRNHLFRTAHRQEQALGEEQVFFIDTCQAQRNELPIPDGPLTVGLDGGIVRARKGVLGEKSSNLFEVIAGKSILAFRRDDSEDIPPSQKRFALVQSYDRKSKRRLFDLLQSQGMQPNQQITFFSDGGDTVRKMQEYLNPESKHILDWFHITMRITVLLQFARGLQKSKPKANEPKKEQQKDKSTDEIEERTLAQRLESIKHFLWHGNTAEALEELHELTEDLECWDMDEEGNMVVRPDAPNAAKMLKCAYEMETYIANNKCYIVNYGERYRNGERISTGFVESTINQVVSKRMVKKQQMQWTPKGAHLLL